MHFQFGCFGCWWHGERPQFLLAPAQWCRVAGEVYTLCGIGLRPRAASMRTRQREGQRAAERAGPNSPRSPKKPQEAPRPGWTIVGYDLQAASLLLLESRLAGMTLGLR